MVLETSNILTNIHCGFSRKLQHHRLACKARDFYSRFLSTNNMQFLYFLFLRKHIIPLGNTVYEGYQNVRRLMQKINTY